MIRPFTAICMSAAFASGLFLYQSKHQAQLLDRQIMGVLKQTEAARERIGVMKAEWALLNEPERLAELSQKHLGLRTLAPTQFVAVADLGSRLPPPVVPGTALPATDEAAAAAPAPVVPVPVAAAPAARLAARVPPAAPVPPPPVQVASAAARPHAPQPEHRAEPAAARPAPVPVVQMAALPVPAAPSMQAVHRPLAPVVSIGAAPIQPRPLAPSSSTPSRGTAASPARDGDLRPAPAVLASSPPAATYQAATPYPSAPSYQSASSYQSALGGARPSLPPPVPYGVAQAR